MSPAPCARCGGPRHAHVWGASGPLQSPDGLDSRGLPLCICGMPDGPCGCTGYQLESASPSGPEQALTLNPSWLP